MTMTLLRFVFIISAAALFTATSAQAHKIRVFAYESDGTIFTEVKFSSGRPAHNTRVVVENKDGSPLLSGTTNETGEFRFAVPQEARNRKQDLHIIADAGEGHRGTWLLEAADYLAGAPVRKDAHEPKPELSAPAADSEKNHSASDYDRELEELIEEIVRQELLPVKRMLAQERERRLSLQDILGGLGYIFGLAGIAAYYKSKRKGDKE